MKKVRRALLVNVLNGIVTLRLLRRQEEEFGPVIPLQLIVLVSIALGQRLQWHTRQFTAIAPEKSQV